MATMITHQVVNKTRGTGMYVSYSCVLYAMRLVPTKSTLVLPRSCDRASENSTRPVDGTVAALRCTIMIDKLNTGRSRPHARCIMITLPYEYS